MARVAIDIDCSSVLQNQKLDLVAKLGVHAKSVTVVTIPSGVALSLNWLGTPIPVQQGAIIEEESLTELYLTTVGTSSSKLWLVAADSRTFFPFYFTARLTGPIQQGLIFNTGLPAAGNNLFASDLLPSSPPAIFRVYVSVAVAGVLSVKRTRSAATVTEQLNSGNVLGVNCAYVFDILVASGDSINLAYSVTGGNILCLQVQEISGNV